MAEWSKAVVLKAIVCKYRGFESLFARRKCTQLAIDKPCSLGEIGKHGRLKICSLWVAGSSPAASIRKIENNRSLGEMAEWSKASDCKSDNICLRRFKSYSLQAPFV